mmetsp:Transcript_50502/g.114710  ORF Transcript_50502/g.114710 Transcript_50502/m.114710 type:complete len:337 (-) Transcript_50502:137-1147(-)
MLSDEETLEHVRLKLKAANFRVAKGDWSRLFEKFDADGSGQIDFVEFHQAVRKVLRVPQTSLSDKEVGMFFRYLDEDCSGTVTIDEMLGYIKRGKVVDVAAEQAKKDRKMAIVHRNLYVGFKNAGCATEEDWKRIFAKRSVLDRLNNENVLPFAELMTLIRVDLGCSFWDLTNRNVREFFDILDTDGSGGLSVDELMVFMRSKPRAAVDAGPKPTTPSPARVPTFRKKLCMRSQSEAVMHTAAFASCSRDFLPRGRSAQTNINRWLPKKEVDRPVTSSLVTSQHQQQQQMSRTWGSSFSVTDSKPRNRDAKLDSLAKKLSEVGALPILSDCRRRLM